MMERERKKNMKEEKRKEREREREVGLGIRRGNKCLQRMVNVGEIGRGRWDWGSREE